jgi:outer membrane autotransporter protein
MRISSSFLDVGAGSFAVTTPNGSPDSALINTGFNIDVNHSATVFVDYMAQAGQSNYFAQSVQAGVKIGF